MRTRGIVVVLCIRIGNEFRINLLRGAIGALGSMTRDKIVTLSKKLLHLPKTPLRGVRFRRGTPDMLAAIRGKSGRRARLLICFTVFSTFIALKLNALSRVDLDFKKTAEIEYFSDDM